MNLPSKHRALIVLEKGKVSIQEKPLPTLSDDAILVHVKAVAINPDDWEHINSLFEPGQGTGSDFSGEIVALGSDTADQGLNIGDRVAGYTRGGSLVPDNGAFQEYVVTLPEMVWRIPHPMTYEDAASMGGIALASAAQAIHHRLNLPYEPVARSEPFLVWGGSTEVGMYAIKLAALAGCKVAAVGPQCDWDLVKSQGAAEAFDPEYPEIARQINVWASALPSGHIKQGFDTKSDENSVEKCVLTLGSGGKLVTFQPIPKLDPNGVDIIGIFAYSPLEEKNMKDFKLMAKWNRKILPGYLEAGKLSPSTIPPKVYKGGLEAIPEALDYSRQRKVSGEKVVVSLRK